MGNFLPESNLIIEYYVQKSNISSLDEYLWRWVEFINVHMLISVVNFRVFLDILNNLIEPIKAGKLSNEEVKYEYSLLKSRYLKLYISYIWVNLLTLYPTARNVLAIDEKNITMLLQRHSNDTTKISGGQTITRSNRKRSKVKLKLNN